MQKCFALQSKCKRKIAQFIWGREAIVSDINHNKWAIMLVFCDNTASSQEISGIPLIVVNLCSLGHK